MSVGRTMRDFGKLGDDQDPIRRLARRGGGDVRIFIQPEQAPARPRGGFLFLPRSLVRVLKLLLLALAIGGATVIPNYVDCRNQRDSGLFYYGMTVGACTRQNVVSQIGNVQRQLETAARAIGGR
ncbi:hypothetical protein [Methylobacterium oryzihabitans]|uniref:Uncharacterized protein n=1 Tax=Methylobacterium oryzihabitans TaxID=2499852 RepID=A0A437NWI6_9HYPH|nr:hypothetical protein [Methylobacterium oryzihabitans]RVU14374.1 hypothetical protein EOE48_23380 [Methylobacterium oryzihabitans]